MTLEKGVGGGLVRIDDAFILDSFRGRYDWWNGGIVFGLVLNWVVWDDLDLLDEVGLVFKLEEVVKVDRG